MIMWIKLELDPCTLINLLQSCKQFCGDFFKMKNFLSFRFFAFFSFLSVLLVSISAEETEKRPDWKLPDNILPLFYRWTIVPFSDSGFQGEVGGQSWTARGDVEIDFLVKKPTWSVFFHAKELEIEQVDITSNEEQNNVNVVKTLDLGSDVMGALLGEELKEGGNYSMRISYHAKINLNDTIGIYRSAYKEPNSEEERWVIATHFQPEFARQAFPCFDEPQYKTPFQIKVGRLMQDKVLSNAELMETTDMENSDHWLWDSFKPTVPISTYNVAFLVASKFHYNSLNSEADERIKIHAPKHVTEGNGTAFALQTAEKVLKFLEEILQQPYPGEKLDLAVVPTAFFGGMEHLGLNIYELDNIVHYPGQQRAFGKEEILRLIAHELAHQFFGNLVTPKDWSQFWLSEGFASYFEFIVLEHLKVEEFDAWGKLVNQVEAVMEIDNLGSSQPLKFNETEMREKRPKAWFDTIMYGKGAALIRMMEGLMTREGLFKGLQSFLNKRKFGTASQEDLFNDLNVELQGNANTSLPNEMNFKEVMEPWTLQTGFPLIYVGRLGKGRFSLQQEKFGDPKSSSLWTIPLKISCNEEPERLVWMTRKTMAIETKCESWISLNSDGSGYYRVHFDPETEKALKGKLLQNHLDIHKYQRAKLIDDSYVNDYKTISQALSFTKYVNNAPETDLVAWNTIQSRLENPLRMMKGAGLLSYARDYFEEGLFKLWEQSPLQEIHNNPNFIDYVSLITWAFELGDSEVEKFAFSQMKQWKKSGENLPPILDYVYIMSCSGMRNDPDQYASTIYKAYKERAEIDTNFDTDVTTMLLNGLGCAQEQDAIERLLNETLKLGYFSKKDHHSQLVSTLASHKNGRRGIVSFLSRILENDEIPKKEIYPMIFAAESYLLGYVTSLQEMKELRDKMSPLLKRKLGIVEWEVRHSQEWVQETGCEYQQFFYENTENPKGLRVPEICKDPQEMLKIKLLENYNSKEMPQLRGPEYQVGMRVTSLSKVDVISDTIEGTGDLLLKWLDPRLKWNPLDHGKLFSIHVPMNTIWTPDWKTTTFQSNFTENIKAKVNSLGEVSATIPGEFKPGCKLDFHYYPFDEHTCEIWNHHPEMSQMKIELLSPEETVGFYNEINEKNKEWSIEKVEKRSEGDSDNDLKQLQGFEVTFRRKSGRDIVLRGKMIAIGITFVILAAALLPPSSPIKIQLSVFGILISSWAVWIFSPVPLLMLTAEPALVGVFLKLDILSFIVLIYSAILFTISKYQGAVPRWISWILGLSQRLCCFKMPEQKCDDENLKDIISRPSSPDSAEAIMAMASNRDRDIGTFDADRKKWNSLAIILDRVMFLFVLYLLFITHSQLYFLL